MQTLLGRARALASLSTCPGTRCLPLTPGPPPRAPPPAHIPPSPECKPRASCPDHPQSPGPRGEDPAVLPGRASTDAPWPQVGMGNADYVAAFLHVLLPVAFEVTVRGVEAVSVAGGWGRCSAQSGTEPLG